MTVGELIKLLENFDLDTQVGFAYNYGDHSRTQVVQSPDDVDELGVDYSDYHDMFCLREGGKEMWVVIT
jgi:hypothetical protein